LNSYSVNGQKPTQVLKGVVIDKETQNPLSGTNVIILNSSPSIGTITNASGKFRLSVETGRVSIKFSFLGYEDVVINDVLIGSGKEVDLNIEMLEKIIQTKEVVINGSKRNNAALNQMASISTQTIRTDDALRYAGGFYDPSRIVNAFAGVATANSDESNDIVIRGNSSRGLLWRLEGIEIPNPNHFSDGQGGSGGAYSAISSNVISNFDFFTGAFPAEYGNAVSGVIDLNLRKGNSEKHEFAFQTGMIGAEFSGEGPLKKESGASFLLDARYANFSILNSLKLIDLGSTNYAPRSTDMVFNINLPNEKRGTLNIFGFYGSSAYGKLAIHNPSAWWTSEDRWEEMQTQGSVVLGIKHLYTIPSGSGYVRSVAAYTYFYDNYSEGYVDSSFIRTNNNYHNYRYPALRLSILLNEKLSPKITIRTGINLNYLGARMDDLNLNAKGFYDTLVYPKGSGLLCQFYAQVKSRISENFEINSGVHILSFSVNGDKSIEPRAGFRWQFAPGLYFNTGVGLHSRAESFTVYYSRIKNSSGMFDTDNKDLGYSKSFQFVSGIDIAISENSSLRVEAYNQHLFEIPIVYKSTSTYSAINSSEALPLSDLSNKGLGFNRGIELTLEKSYTRNYYYLFTLSLLNSKFMPGDGQWYNTYYNTNYVSNLLAGKDFYFGKNKRNSIGINAKYLIRGGYRYTPVDMLKSIKSKKIIYNTGQTYGAQLPEFVRIDSGLSFRKNMPGFSWIIMLDVQNLTDRKNVFSKKFSYLPGQIITNNEYSIGAVPVFDFRIEF